MNESLEDHRRNDDDDDDEEDAQDAADGKEGGGDDQREQDRFLPIANIARIMKTQLPSNAKIAKDAKESIQECVSEYISFITSEASDKCLQEKRKTINGDDILWAMSTLGFDKYIDPLKTYLHKYREAVQNEKPEKKPTEAALRRAEKARLAAEAAVMKASTGQYSAKKGTSSASKIGGAKAMTAGVGFPMKMGSAPGVAGAAGMPHAAPGVAMAMNGHTGGLTPAPQLASTPTAPTHMPSMPVYAPVAMTHPTSIGASYINPPMPPGMTPAAGPGTAIKREADGAGIGVETDLKRPKLEN